MGLMTMMPQWGTMPARFQQPMPMQQPMQRPTMAQMGNRPMPWQLPPMPGMKPPPQPMGGGGGPPPFRQPQQLPPQMSTQAGGAPVDNPYMRMLKPALGGPTGVMQWGM